MCKRGCVFGLVSKMQDGEHECVFYRYGRTRSAVLEQALKLAGIQASKKEKLELLKGENCVFFQAYCPKDYPMQKPVRLNRLKEAHARVREQLARQSARKEQEARRCKQCGADISDRTPQTKYCDTCRKKKYRESMIRANEKKRQKLREMMEDG